LCDPPRPCEVYVTAYGAAHGASLSDLQPQARTNLQAMADRSGHDIGVNATTNGTHCDPRHNGESICSGVVRPSRPELRGNAVDIGEVDHTPITTSSTTLNGALRSAAAQEPSVRDLITPTSFETRRATGLGGLLTTCATQGCAEQVKLHSTHAHLTFFSTDQR